MREALKNAVQSAILFECQLPHQESGLGKSWEPRYQMVI